MKLQYNLVLFSQIKGIQEATLITFNSNIENNMKLMINNFVDSEEIHLIIV